VRSPNFGLRAVCDPAPDDLFEPLKQGLRLFESAFGYADACERPNAAEAAEISALLREAIVQCEQCWPPSGLAEAATNRFYRRHRR
jgi:hypothetical protein